MCIKEKKDIPLIRVDKRISLYIHLPFCSKKCDYCDFFSVDTAGVEEKRKTVTKILEETSYFLDILQPRSIDTIYIGGGTPNSLSTPLFHSLLQGLAGLADTFEEKFSEWTIELNPELLTDEQIDVLKEVGVTRLSLGVQSFSDTILSLIGRRAKAEDAHRALSLIRERWKGDWSGDCITLLPGERYPATESSFEDIETLLSYGPQHLSLYGLTAEEGTAFYKNVQSGRLILPHEEEAARLLARQWNALKQRGFLHYEISNFAAYENKKSTHNMRYWRLDPYLGIGPSAVSTLPGKKGPLRLRSPAELSLPESTVYEVEEISPSGFLLEHFLTGFRTSEGVSFSRIADRFGSTVADRIEFLLRDKLVRLEEGGYIFLRDRGFAPSDNGMLISDSIILDLTRSVDTLDVKRVQWP